MCALCVRRACLRARVCYYEIDPETRTGRYAHERFEPVVMRKRGSHRSDDKICTDTKLKKKEKKS